ncbi:MAG: hypothetical protein GX552_09650 [Chloroflexi bacterium]|nr:hypothetical protein [Chloroflexota bacterium]
MKRSAPWPQRHPRLTMWTVLAVGMIAILLVAAHGKGFSVGQFGWLVASCVALAGACSWIIGWE